MKEYIDSFLNYLMVEKGFSKNTEEAYRNDLFQLENFHQRRGFQTRRYSFMGQF